MSVPPPSGGGFSLFPNTSNTRPPSRNQPHRPRAPTPQGGPSNATETTPPRGGRQTPVKRSPSVREGKQKEVSNNPWQHALDASRQPSREEERPRLQEHEQQQQQQPQQEPQQQPPQPQPQQQPQYHFQPPPVLDTTSQATAPQGLALNTTFSPISAADVPPRCDTALSEAKTLVRSPSVRSRSSISKPPLVYQPPGMSTAAHEAPAIRSIFPQYNPEVPLDRQDYYPTQASPVHIPQSAISRPLYSPRNVNDGPKSPDMRSMRSPALSPGFSAQGSKFPGRNHEPAPIAPVSSTEELRGLWKASNGWKASALEGRTYCMKMTAQPDAPIYTLASASSQPFYSLRVDPTSASAIVSLSRYDPNKPFKSNLGLSLTNPTGSSSPRASSSSKTEAKNEKHDAKNWQEVLSTTLEEASRKQPPNDGLVALLWPAAATRLAADPSNDATTVMMAEQECARLVWDADSSGHFLVHPALAMPFAVTIERHAAYSRTEYTLEHIESPVPLARLTRDGTGAGYLEVDTAIASKVDAVYLVDVAVTALLLVAHSDDQFHFVEAFEPPPVIGSRAGSVMSKRDGRRSSSRLSRSSRRDSKREEKERQKAESKKPKNRMEQFEIDIESQTSELGKMYSSKGGDKEKVPGLARGLITLLTVVFKCVIWCITLVFKALMGLIKCLGSEKL
ncbi:hypothetical protein V8F06_001792 [Rhypophila decipiens]